MGHGKTKRKSLGAASELLRCAAVVGCRTQLANRQRPITFCLHCQHPALPAPHTASVFSAPHTTRLLSFIAPCLPLSPLVSWVQIAAHPWFLSDLPPGALDMNEWYMQNAPQLDPVRQHCAHSTRRLCLMAFEHYKALPLIDIYMVPCLQARRPSAPLSSSVALSPSATCLFWAVPARTLPLGRTSDSSRVPCPCPARPRSSTTHLWPPVHHLCPARCLPLQIVPLIDEIVGLATREGLPQDPQLSCPFQPLNRPAGG